MFSGILVQFTKKHEADFSEKAPSLTAPKTWSICLRKSSKRAPIAPLLKCKFGHLPLGKKQITQILCAQRSPLSTWKLAARSKILSYHAGSSPLDTQCCIHCAAASLV